MPAPKPALKYQLLPELGGAEPRQRRPGLSEVLHGAAALLLTARRPSPSAPATRRCRSPSCRLEPAARSTAARRSGRRTGRPGWIRSTGRPSSASRTAAWRRLPAELGPLQVLAAALQVRFRAEVAGRHFDDAIRTAKTMFALARHLGEHPTEVANLVGLWVAHLGLGTPGGDGAAARLPQPLLGADRSALPPGGSAQGRAGRPHPGRGGAAAAPRRRPHDGSRARNVREPSVRHAEFRPRTGGPAAPEPAGPAASAGQGPGASRAPPAAAWSTRVCAQDLVDKFPPLQVILLDEKRDYEIQRDERIKLLSLPLWQIDSLAGGEERATEAGTGCSPISCPTSSSSAGHRGSWSSRSPCCGTSRPCASTPRNTTASCPRQLSDISVPLPVDPFTGKPFDYTVEGTTAHLRGGSLSGEESTSRDAPSTTR